MAKFDFDKLAEKLNLDKVVANVKSIIQPESIIPKNLEGDPIAAKLTLLRECTQNLNDIIQKQQGEIAKINTLVGSLYQDLSALKPPSTSESPGSGEKQE